MVNFYYRFVPAAASIMLPLYSALVGKLWDDTMTSAFNLTKEALAIMLAHSHADAPTTITVDASGVGVDAVPWQLGILQSATEKKYSAFDRELLRSSLPSSEKTGTSWPSQTIQLFSLTQVYY